MTDQAHRRRRGLARNPWVREQESRTCRQCGAEPGQQCVTTAGTIAMRPHMGRFYDAGGTPDQDARRVSDRERRVSIKQRVLEHYGTACACCGVTENLTIDHVNGNGKQHRNEVGHEGGTGFYAWLIRNSFPPGFQTLCNPCNVSKFDGENCRMHPAACPTCRRPFDDGVQVTLKVRAGYRRRKVAAAQPPPPDRERMET